MGTKILYGGTMVPVYGQSDPEGGARFMLDEARWNNLIELLEQPPSENPALRRLLTESSVLEKEVDG